MTSAGISEEKEHKLIGDNNSGVLCNGTTSSLGLDNWVEGSWNTGAVGMVVGVTGSVEGGGGGGGGGSGQQTHIPKI